MTLVKLNNPVTKSFDGILNEIFKDLPANFGKASREDVFGFPPVNIVELENSYQLELVVPGLEKTDFEIKLDGNLLIISSNKKEDSKAEHAKVVRKEFSIKSFKRSFTLDEKIEASAIDAKYENGILKLNLPKKETAKVASKEITIQ
jgi:HSP20 family protein